MIISALEAWLPVKLNTAYAHIENLHSPKGAGFSNETCLFDAVTPHGTQKLVLQAPPARPGLLPRTDIMSMAQIQSCLSQSGVPVAPIIGVETDPTVLGTPFYVMRQVPGRVATDTPPYHREGWFADLSANEQNQIWRAGITTLAKLHALDASHPEFSFLTHADWGMPLDADPALTRIAQWRKFLAWSSPDKNPHIDRALDRLEREKPCSPERLSLCWGDSKLSNMIVQNGKIAAVLDWEFCGLSTPDEDLAHWLLLDWTLFAAPKISRLTNLPSYSDTIALYEAAAGRKAGNVLWWFRFALVRLAIIYHRFMELRRQNGRLAPGADIGVANPVGFLLMDMFAKDEWPC